MADDDRNNPEGEYQFREDQDVPEYKYEEESPTVQPKRKRPLAVVIAVVIAFFVLYEVGHFVFNTHKKEAAMHKQSIEKKMPPVEMKTTDIQKSAMQQAPAISDQTTSFDSSATTDADLNHANSDLKDIAEQMSALQSTNKSVLDSIEKQQFQAQTTQMSLQETLNNLNGQLAQISEGLQTVTKEYEQKQDVAKKKALAEKRHEATIRHKKKYFVDAVIPGRAWLKAVDGKTATVTIGQTLPGYGRIILIDPYSGVVKTSVGGMIPYGTSASN